jgi:GTP-binding protein EngB required for normal cell division
MRLPFFWRKAAPPSVPSIGGHEPAHEPAAEKPSRILKEVLREPDPGEPQKPSEIDVVPLSRRLSVGARLDHAKVRAIEAAEKLVAHADKETAQIISSVAEELRSQACRIAFVGQMKAGKSSLINVLVERPEFLPADINPCTAVVTRLNFGVPGKPRDGAAFTFFSRDEWRRLSQGGRTRELTDKLFPDFDWEILKAQVGSMEENARKKLGSSFEDLLGKEHAYPRIEPHLLSRYVGTEYSSSGIEAEHGEGEYSDITRSADIFLDLGAFNFPTVLIDTPGVNDPFLVRDEITRQNLELADICVVVITAWQRLSATDLNLLRMLRGLKKDRLIVFVNKVDELKGGEEVVRQVGQQVSATLEAEFPSAHIPVVLGSAAFAHKALDPRGAGLASGRAAAASDSDAATVAELASAGLDWLISSDLDGADSNEDYFEKSGLLQLAVAVSETMSAGPIAVKIANASRLLENVSRNAIAWREIEAGLLDLVRSEPSRAEKELAALSVLRGQLAAKFEAFTGSLGVLEAQKTALIKQRLSAAMNSALPRVLASVANGDAAERASQIDVKMRIRLEMAFQEALEDIGNTLENEQELLKLELSKVLAAASLHSNPISVLGQPRALTPSLAALSEPAALTFIARSISLPDGLADGCGLGANLESLIVEDFTAIIEKLAHETSMAFRQSATGFAAQAQALTFGPLDSMTERLAKALMEARTRPQAEVETRLQAIRDAISNLKPIVEAGLAVSSA